MPPVMPRAEPSCPGVPDRRRALGLLAGLTGLTGVVGPFGLTGCGGGGGGDGGGGTSAPGGSGLQGTRVSTALLSRLTGTSYPLSLYVPPASAGPRNRWPLLVLLDGETWFEPVMGWLQLSGAHVLVVAVHGAGMRARDFVPTNNCTSGGGGNGVYLDFLRQELLPFVEGTHGGNPAGRVLFGHSHGGSFVLHALFSEAPGQHSFRAYLASDSSIGCMPDQVLAWEQAYAARHSALPVRLHLSYATGGNYTANLNTAAGLAQRRFTGLTLVQQAYTGTHLGIVPQVLADALPFALATGA